MLVRYIIQEHIDSVKQENSVHSSKVVHDPSAAEATTAVPRMACGIVASAVSAEYPQRRSSWRLRSFHHRGPADTRRAALGTAHSTRSGAHGSGVAGRAPVYARVRQNEQSDVRLADPTTVEDEKFDSIYPPQIRTLSPVFWTPVHIAAEAAKLLVTAPGARVLDIGSGAGKFCLVGARLTDGQFTGVEQRPALLAAARAAAAELGLHEVQFLDANVLDLSFADYDAFYIFNPFEENMFNGHKIDAAVPLSLDLFKRYTSYVAAELGARPIGTRVVTYMGYADEIPSCYSCESTLFGDDLKVWVKTREYDPAVDALGLIASRSYRGSMGWTPPR